MAMLLVLNNGVDHLKTKENAMFVSKPTDISRTYNIDYKEIMLFPVMIADGLTHGMS